MNEEEETVEGPTLEDLIEQSNPKTIAQRQRERRLQRNARRKKKNARKQARKNRRRS